MWLKYGGLWLFIGLLFGCSNPNTPAGFEDNIHYPAIARKEAEIRVEEAKGIAQAQKIINATLTPNYLQHEAINAQLKMAESPNHTTVYIPVGNNGIPIVKGAH